MHPPASLYPSVSVIRHQKREGWKTLKKDIPSMVREVAIVFFAYFLEDNRPLQSSTHTHTCAMVKSRYIGDGHPTFKRNPYNGYINPYYSGLMTISYYMEIMGV